MILFWNKKYHLNDYGVGLGQAPFLRFGCRVNNCIFTNDRQKLNQSDALLFFVLGFNRTDLPQHRLPHQRYIFNLYETMYWSKNYGNIPLYSNTTNNFFNWTMTYRRDSDIFDPNPHGILVAKNKTMHQQLPLRNRGEAFRTPTKILANLPNPSLVNRTKLIAWFCSHQKTFSKREIYFKELSKHIPVDIYGKCGNLVCPAATGNCDRLLDSYKFYIAAENSFCPDYVTEKFYRALASGVVPVVYGGADYSQYAPPHSYINAADFRSPQKLAEYLLLLDQNDALYMEYFHWREFYQVSRGPKQGWCEMCAKLNDPSEPVKIYESMAQFWHHDIPCVDGVAYLNSVLPSEVNNL